MAPERVMDCNVPVHRLEAWTRDRLATADRAQADVLVLRPPREARYDLADLRAWKVFEDRLSAQGMGLRWIEPAPASYLLDLVAGSAPPRVAECLHCDVSGETLRWYPRSHPDGFAGLDQVDAYGWIAAWAGGTFVVDLMGVDQVNSRLINWLLLLRQRAEEGGMRLVRANERVLSVLRQMRLDHVLTLE